MTAGYHGYVDQFVCVGEQGGCGVGGHLLPGLFGGGLCRSDCYVPRDAPPDQYHGERHRCCCCDCAMLEPDSACCEQRFGCGNGDDDRRREYAAHCCGDDSGQHNEQHRGACCGRAPAACGAVLCRAIVFGWHGASLSGRVLSWASASRPVCAVYRTPQPAGRRATGGVCRGLLCRCCPRWSAVAPLPQLLAAVSGAVCGDGFMFAVPTEQWRGGRRLWGAPPVAAVWWRAVRRNGWVCCGCGWVGVAGAVNWCGGAFCNDRCVGGGGLGVFRSLVERSAAASRLCRGAGGVNRSVARRDAVWREDVHHEAGRRDEALRLTVWGEVLRIVAANARRKRAAGDGRAVR